MELANKNIRQLIEEHQALSRKIRTEKARLRNKQDEILEKKAKAMSNKNVDDMKMKLNFAGSKGDINSMIWPFFFASEMKEVGAGKNEVLNVTISQEAPFSLISIQKVVFRWSDANSRWEYINPRAVDANGVEAGMAAGLKFSIVDTQSGRSWFGNPVSLDHIGGAEKPYVLPSPQLQLPNSNTEIQLFNNGSEKFMVGVLFQGYRVRIKDAQELLSLVTE